MACRAPDAGTMTNESASPYPDELAVRSRPVVVGDVMTRAVIAAYPGADVEDVGWMLTRHDIDCVPVIGEDRRVLGVVSGADLLDPASLDQPDEPHRVVTARQLMTSPPVTTTVGAPIDEVGECMARHGVHSLPVLDEDGALVGIVARSDVMRACYSRAL